ncbi:anthranilate synthase component II [Dyella caseinilytica]|uniref:Aminodeoxychorismate/anthranilate synthase component II n=1 Tax=Dyella caseinilytica TaxID=1849581 RepID=A0ABX7GS55_9GAMM|nr:aminodeoxychorismate/anthranilate synthase component II [Dyella caseinilytica]QRN53222.1 aminodeoxychorismate/anthranilate synthase component II [Dyella caseinilytica]GGA12400.1 glutamine amidotransferase [Dyella caseinilytica]
MKTLLVDAYDSFVHIIANYLEVLGLQPDVVRCNEIDVAAIGANYQSIVLGPGPGHPRESGYLNILSAHEGKLPIFGVCLGMQAIAEYYGVPVVQAAHRRHGKVSTVEHTSQGCFMGLPSPMEVTRYHSLVADRAQLPSSMLDVTAESLDDHYVMGLKHRTHPIEGVQFHPESVTTPHGLDLIRNALLSH